MTAILGILNVTPDSFSDGGRFASVDAAISHGLELHRAGAQIVDVGGESTRPGATRIPAAEEQQRVLPVIAALVAEGVTVSVDTLNAATAAAAIAAGAAIVNDVSAGLADTAMAGVIADSDVTYIAMHGRGAADAAADYRDVVTEVRDELAARVAALEHAGVPPHRVLLDPGLGFAKTAEHNWALLGRLDALAALGHPLVVGASRKRFLAPWGEVPADRDLATAVISALCAREGVWGVRVHDVAASRAAIEVAERWAAAAAPAPLTVPEVRR